VQWWWNIPLSPMWLWVLASAGFVGLMALIVIEFSRVLPRAAVSPADGSIDA
jgi:hypothetical protein